MKAPTDSTLSTRLFSLTVIIAGLGYFIDMFDMFLFNVMRVPSLTELGLKGAALTDAGMFISNFQMLGFIFGAYLSGLLGDRIGRKKVLFLSITLYSLGSLGSAFVQNVPMYAAMRCLAGLGLAGELGSGITLIAEKFSAGRRGAGMMIFIMMGFTGVFCSAIAGGCMYWRHAYILGGVLGLFLFFTRMLLKESRMFDKMAKTDVKRGGLKIIFKKSKLLKPYLGFIFLLSCSVFVPQILWTLSPEIGQAMGIPGTIKANTVIQIGYGCVIIGDLLAMALSEILKSRKKTAIIFLCWGAVWLCTYILFPPKTVTDFMIRNGLFGLTFGVWVSGIAWAAESFATNIRSTVATTTPNFARALTIPMNIIYAGMKGFGILTAVGCIGAFIFLSGYVGWRSIRDSYGKDLAYVE